MARPCTPSVTAAALVACSLVGIGFAGCRGEPPTQDDRNRPVEASSGGCETLDAPMVNLGDLAMVFAPNVGQSPGGPPIFGIDLGAGTMTVSDAGIRLDLLGQRGSPDAIVTIQHLNGATGFAAERQLDLPAGDNYIAPF